jgi:hypothetical protein
MLAPFPCSPMVRLPHNPSLAPLASRGRGGSQDCSARAVRVLLRRQPVTVLRTTSPVWQDSRGRPSLPPGWQVRGRAPSARCAWAEATCRACRTRLPESKVTRYLPLATVRAHLWAAPAGLMVRAARAGRFQIHDGDLAWQFLDIWSRMQRERIMYIGQDLDDEYANQVCRELLRASTPLQCVPRGASCREALVCTCDHGCRCLGGLWC